jgi:predicted RecA/RadA family phage recombinase
MPTTYVVDNDKATALSIGGGAHWEIETDDADVVAATSGDLIVFGDLVGFALTDYDSEVGSIVVSTTGAYEVEVVAEDDAGDDAVYVGSWLYWDAAADEVNRDDTNGVPIGQALEAIPAGETATIGVILRPSPPG